jgi:hypothetical protein
MDPESDEEDELPSRVKYSTIIEEEEFEEDEEEEEAEEGEVAPWNPRVDNFFRIQ